MKSARAFRCVLVTAPNLKTARRLARAALESRLAACVNLLPSIESHYWWKSKIEHADEVLLLLKTSRRHLARLEALVLGSHPYDTPEFLVLPIESGAAQYLEWLAASLNRFSFREQKPQILER